jgi:hypothetical protein
MRADSKENLLLEKPATSGLTSGASEDRTVPAENSHGESALLWLADLAEEFDAEQVAVDARSLAERVSEGRFYVACIGQFKRGKSSVLNALVGDSVLPTGVVPVTAVPTIVRYGRRATARVRFEAGEWTDIPVKGVDEYVSEEKNPENAKQVPALEIFVPSPLLCDGHVLCGHARTGIGIIHRLITVSFGDLKRLRNLTPPTNGGNAELSIYAATAP